MFDHLLNFGKYLYKYDFYHDFSVVFVSAASFPACTKTSIPHNILSINACKLCEMVKWGVGNDSQAIFG